MFGGWGNFKPSADEDHEEPEWISSFQSPKEPTNDGPQARARAPHVTRRLLLSDDDSDNNCLLAPPTKAKANHDEPKAWEQDPGRTARTPTNLSLDVDDVELAPASVQLTQTQTQEPNADEEHDAQVKQAHLSIRSSSTVLTFPERVSTAKMLVECDPEDTELDLSGDAGAVGRLLEGTPQADCGTRRDPFKLDLKGVMYSASIQPCSTMLIVNLTGGGEARVESVFHDFVRLEEDYQQGRTVHHGNLDVNLYSSDSDEDLAPKKKTKTENKEANAKKVEAHKGKLARKTTKSRGGKSLGRGRGRGRDRGGKKQQ
mmetsp:Transcript_1198/g.4240  ORF Transcript_1198/g.4240 Transcript_1198/m.4240 type:complete len:315 (+) Transcript_1198:95-1039(+)